MVKQDLINHSPVRLFEKISDGGLKSGQMGLITAKKGLGKTSVLVQFGLDALIQDKPLVHVSFDQHSSNVITWYENVLSEIGKKKNFGDTTELNESIVSNRIILNFNQENFTLPKVVRTIKALKEGGTNISAIVVDGADFSKISKEDIASVADYVKSEKIVAWFSDTNEAAKLSETVSKDFLPYFSTVGHLASSGNSVELTVLKSDDKEIEPVSLKIDSKTMLMSK
ncbi:MAG: hypothetical protein ACTTJG_06360 [Treponema sp.]|jgi:hypothetical protein